MSRKARVVDAREFNGMLFRRYPEAKDTASRNYWRTGGSPRRGIVPKSLHREMWIAAHGEIPPGFEVHHKDGNPLNTVLENLECLSPEEHAQRHRDDVNLRAWQREHLAEVRPAHRDWVKTPEYKAMLSERTKELWANAEVLHRNCSRCGAAFTTRDAGRRGLLCSPTCRVSEWRKRQTENRTCANCGCEYVGNRLSTGRSCSRKCANALAAQARRKRP